MSLNLIKMVWDSAFSQQTTTNWNDTNFAFQNEDYTHQKDYNVKLWIDEYLFLSPLMPLWRVINSASNSGITLFGIVHYRHIWIFIPFVSSHFHKFAFANYNFKRSMQLYWKHNVRNLVRYTMQSKAFVSQ